MGENHSARLLLYSFNFQEIASLQKLGSWESLCQKMIDAARILQKAHADLIVICSNTMHRCSEKVQEEVPLPVLHIAESVGRCLIEANIKKTGLLGTKYLLQSSDYQEILLKKFNIPVVIPNQDGIETINQIIYTELVKGIIRNESRQKVLKVIKEMLGKEIGAIILGCTEIPLLIRQEDCPIPVIDTTWQHAIDAVEASLADIIDI